VCQFDADQSGSISRSEFPALFAEMQGRDFKLPAGMTADKAFENVDASGDGKAQFSELVQYFKNQGTFQS